MPTPFLEPAKDMWLWGKTGSKRTENMGIKGFFIGRTVARRYLFASEIFICWLGARSENRKCHVPRQLTKDLGIVAK